MSQRTPQAFKPTEEHFGSIAKLFAVLADPTRLRILHALESGPRTVSQLVELLGTTQANTSKHLSLLAERGLVRGTRDGMFMRYAICDAMVFGLCRTVCDKLIRDGELALASARALHRFADRHADRHADSPRSVRRPRGE